MLVGYMLVRLSTPNFRFIRIAFYWTAGSNGRSQSCLGARNLRLCGGVERSAWRPYWCAEVCVQM
jgi:hypothetical protein